MAPVTSTSSNTEEEVTSPQSKSKNLQQSGDVLRLDVPIPFFLKNEVFSNFGKPDYSWNNGGDLKMALLVEVPEKSKNWNTVDTLKSDGFVPKKKTPVDLSIGGCPLECPFDLNEDFEEALAVDTIPFVFEGLRISAKYSPLQMDYGKCSITKISRQVEPFVKDLNLVEDSEGWFSKDMPVFAFVDDSYQNAGIGKTLVGFRRKLKVIGVHSMGVHRPESNIMDIASVHKFHAQNVFMENHPATSVAHAVYEKLRGESPSNGKVYLEFVFKEPTNIFELPPEDCLCKIAIKPLPGDANPSMKALWSEIQDLERWIEISSQSFPDCNRADATSFLNSTVGEISENKITSNVQAVQDLLSKEPAAGIFNSSSIADFSDSLDSVLQRVVKEERTDSDFTDKLWSAVRQCENVDELQDCLQVVFQAVSNKMYRPYILLNNDTIMAKNLFKVMKGEVGSLLQLRRQDMMVKMVVECGLRKLYKDYSFILGMSHLIERGDVDAFSPLISNMLESLLKVKKLHCILEVMCLSKERLSLSGNILEAHVKKMLANFSDPKTLISWDETYHFDVPPNDVKRMMNGLHPIYFKIKMDSVTLLKWTTTTVVFTQEDYILYKKNQTDELNLRQYYVYVINENGMLGDV